MTRPAHQAGSLAQRIEQAGGEAILFPVLDIAAPTDPAAFSHLLARLDQFDLAIFISPNAVHAVLQAMPAGLPQRLALAAVGQGTRRRLLDAGAAAVLAPVEKFTSEGLLELLPAAQVAGKKIIILRGNRGRERLAEALAARGAAVTELECYRRLLPGRPDPATLARVQRGEVDVVTITSVDGLHNLLTLAGELARPLLLRLPVVVVSKRQARACREQGFSAALQVAARADDAAVLDALHAWRAAGKPI